ncbi:metal-dependent transcriptional regulator [Tichowtungia aerotolerans]|uniref:Transcriptional regulator MntR n=1 Tax=Tichowtungia aerotolerans TaxID=2697043 RepID=A0A6P1M393_9BACT|nr:metal-dependent transcriptional regulator [Tichowtungia aerotolerans]QHI68317.1 MarR family transcriptional regulator [Tichowtungia aerotolerans]
MTNLSSSLEDYLEAIFEIAENKGAARPKDIANRLKVKPASVTGALKHLSEKNLVNYAPYDVVTLTATGKRIAKSIAKKHKALLNFFTNVLDIPRGEVEDFACKMEHIIPDHVLERFVEFAEFVDKCPNRGAIWREGAHGYFCTAHGVSQTLCDSCQLDSK